MEISSISNLAAATATTNTTPKTSSKSTDSTDTATKAESTGVIYEKSTADEDTTTTNSTANNKAIVAKLKADAEQRTAQLRSLVETMMQKQGVAIGNSDSMWKFLASGDFTVSAETKAQAQADIAEDGYWGVEQTSDRILDFAKALSGNDPEKADDMLAAFKKGFEEATKTWGSELPDISQRTYDAVIEKFNAWKAEAGTITE